MVDAAQELKIKAITGDFLYHNSKFSLQAIPDGWIWQDIGNYYGAGAFDINWKENQYELHLASGNKIGGEVNFNGHVDYNYHGIFKNELVSAEKGSGDNAYIYLGTENAYPLLKGTIPVGEKDFIISGAYPNPPYSLVEDIKSGLLGKGIHFTKQNEWVSTAPVAEIATDSIKNGHELLSFVSPPFDSLNFWFLRKSINLYGEAFLKTITLEKEGYASTEKGVALLKKFWEGKGVESAALNIMDGCGLSPQNRVTANALVNALQYARTRNWYASFYNALPEYNGMKMKSGSINGARAYAGYHVSKTNKSYTFAIIINNYDGLPSDVIKKMFIALDILK